MTTDPELITHVRAKLKDLRGDRHDAVERDLEDYGIACELSRGPDKARARHWAGKGRMLESRLRKLVQPVSVPRAAGSVS